MTLIGNPSLWPLTDTIGLVNLGLEEAVSAWCAWTGPIQGPGQQLVRRDVAGSTEELMASLTPLSTWYDRNLFIPTREDAWTVYLCNGPLGTDPVGFATQMALRTGRATLSLTDADDGVQFTLNGRDDVPEGHQRFAHGQVHESDLRGIDCVVSDSGRWVFETYGAPLPWEDTSAYTARRKRDRFGPDELTTLCAGLGVHLRDPRWINPYQRGVLITREGPKPNYRAFTLLEQQVAHGRPALRLTPP